MSISGPLPVLSGNRLLDLLPKSDYRRLFPHLEMVPLKFKQILYEPRSVIDHVFFPREGAASMVSLMENGSGIEVGIIGREGLIGLGGLLGEEHALARYIVSVRGSALKIKVNVVKEEISKDTPLRRLLLLYLKAFLKQTVQSGACNGLHSVSQRCCRWLLKGRDRVDSDQFVLTHEFLADMLGVRRSSVSEVLELLQEKGWIYYHRGKIKILKRKGLESAACECYRNVKDDFDRLFG
jgi:CRP-like cAMP-binding protein